MAEARLKAEKEEQQRHKEEEEEQQRRRMEEVRKAFCLQHSCGIRQLPPMPFYFKILCSCF
jgi:hypothetical protein